MRPLSAAVSRDHEIVAAVPELGDGGYAEQLHRAAQLGDEEVNGVLDSRLPGGGEAVEVSAADHAHVGPSRDGHGDVRAMADGGVDNKGDTFAHRLSPRPHHVDRRDRAVELTAAVA